MAEMTEAAFLPSFAVLGQLADQRGLQPHGLKESGVLMDQIARRSGR